MKYACPSCDQHLESGDEYAGMSAQCPNCGTDFTIPSAPGERLSASKAPPFVPTTPKAPVRQADASASSTPKPHFTAWIATWLVMLPICLQLGFLIIAVLIPMGIVRNLLPAHRRWLVGLCVLVLVAFGNIVLLELAATGHLDLPRELDSLMENLGVARLVCWCVNFSAIACAAIAIRFEWRRTDWMPAFQFA